MALAIIIRSWNLSPTIARKFQRWWVVCCTSGLVRGGVAVAIKFFLLDVLYKRSYAIQAAVSHSKGIIYTTI